MTLRAAALASAQLAMLLAIGSSPAPAPATAATNEHPAPPRITMIADSVGGVLYWVTSAREKLGRGLDFHLDARTCRKLVLPGCYAYGASPPSVLETVRALGPELGQIVVVNVGYNDVATEYARGIDTIMQALGGIGVQHVVWVTLEEAQPNWAEMNGYVRAARTRWPDLVVADWADAAAEHADWFVDGVHMNATGGEAFASFLRPLLLEVCGPPCAPPRVPTMLDPDGRRRAVLLRWTGVEGASSYDLAVRPAGGTWRTVASRLNVTSYRLRGTSGLRLWARVRCRDAQDTPGAWSSSRRISVLPAVVSRRRAPG